MLKIYTHDEIVADIQQYCPHIGRIESVNGSVNHSVSALHLFSQVVADEDKKLIQSSNDVVKSEIVDDYINTFVLPKINTTPSESVNDISIYMGHLTSDEMTLHKVLSIENEESLTDEQFEVEMKRQIALFFSSSTVLAMYDTMLILDCNGEQIGYFKSVNPAKAM
jgi:hypothetical protein